MNNPAHYAAELARRLRLIEATRWRMPGDVPTRQMVRRDWVVERFMTGKLQVALNGSAWQTLGPGDAIVYAPGCRVAERAVAERRPCSSLYIRFTGPDARLRVLLRMRSTTQRIDDRDAVLAAVIDRAAEYFNGGVAANLQALAQVYEALACVMIAPMQAGVRVVRPMSSEGAVDLVTAVNRHLREHLASKLRLSDLAEHIGMSESGLSHAYRRLSGRSPMAALRAFRIEAAKVMLARGGMKLAAIAPRTGFADAFHLSRTFQQVVGLSPRKFVMQHRVTGRIKTALPQTW